MSLQTSYRFIAPFYDAFIQRATASQRKHSLAQLPEQAGRVLLSGVGTGLDFPHLPAQHQYTALDLTRAMLQRSRARAQGLDLHWVQGDSMALPFAEDEFDSVVLHLIVAVVPEPQRCLAEAARVLKPGGTIILFDKFLHPEQRAPLRRLFNVITRRFATRMDVVFEEVLRAAPELEV